MMLISAMLWTGDWSPCTFRKVPFSYSSDKLDLTVALSKGVGKSSGKDKAALKGHVLHNVSFITCISSVWCKMKGLLHFWCCPETAFRNKSLLYTTDQEAEKLKIYIRKATPLHISAWLSLNEVPWGFCFAWCPCQTASMNRSNQREPLRSTHQIWFNLCLYAHCLSSHWPLLGSGLCWLAKVREDCSLSSLRWQHKGTDVS